MWEKEKDKVKRCTSFLNKDLSGLVDDNSGKPYSSSKRNSSVKS